MIAADIILFAEALLAAADADLATNAEELDAAEARLLAEEGGTPFADPECTVLRWRVRPWLCLVVWQGGA